MAARRFDDLLRGASGGGASGVDVHVLTEQDELILKYGTEEEQRQYLQLRKLDEAYNSPLSFAMYVTPGTKAYPHTKLLDKIIVAHVENRLYPSGIGPEPDWVPDDADVLDDEEGHWEHPTTGERPVEYLAIAMPPRHGKSFVVSQHLPAWYIGKYPDRKVALASYAEDFSATWGGLNRDHFVVHPELGIQVKRGKNAASSEWETSKGGGMFSVGIGGGVTGRGFPLMIIDDPIKNSEEAQSEATQTKQHNWWTSTWTTRKQPYNRVMTKFVLMFTRWAEGDLSGKVVFDEEGKVRDGWYYLHLPALCIDPEIDPLGRQEGEPLCPQRFTKRQLEEIRDDPTAAVGWWDALYQGVPFTVGSGITAGPFQQYSVVKLGGKREYFYLVGDERRSCTEDECLRFGSIDVAGTVQTVSDWNVFSVYDWAPDGTLFHIAQERKRLESADHVDWAKKLYDEHGCQLVIIEDRTFGTTLLQHLKRDPKYVTVSMKADTDKVTRAIPYGAAILNGFIRFPDTSPAWWSKFVSEHVAFPNGTHDDQVDAGAYAYRYIMNIERHVRKKESPKTVDQEHQDRITRQITRRTRATRESNVAAMLRM